MVIEMINPIKINGLWNEGYALDYHTVSSEYIGEDPFGHKRFSTTYTEVGNLLHMMKYNGHQNTTSDIIRLCIPFLNKWLADKNIDCIIPVPPTNSRDLQPVFEIAKGIADCYNIPYADTVLTKISSVQSKNLTKENKDLTGTIMVLKTAQRKCNLLLIDDFYSTGATATECVKKLKEDKLIENIYLFAITKTRT